MNEEELRVLEQLGREYAEKPRPGKRPERFDDGLDRNYREHEGDDQKELFED